MHASVRDKLTKIKAERLAATSAKRAKKVLRERASAEARRWNSSQSVSSPSVLGSRLYRFLNHWHNVIEVLLVVISSHPDPRALLQPSVQGRDQSAVDRGAVNGEVHADDLLREESIREEARLLDHRSLPQRPRPVIARREKCRSPDSAREGVVIVSSLRHLSK